MKNATLSATEPSESKRILFIGNSPNQLIRENEQYAWRNLLDNMEAAIRDEIGYEASDADMPFSARAVRLKNFIKQKGADSSDGSDFCSWEQCLESISKLDAGKFHLLVKELLPQHFQAVLTTNYDYTFERVLYGSAPTKAFSGGKVGNATRRHGEVWHLHGEALDPESIIMTSSDYIEAVSLLKNETEESWLKLFLQSDVYVCGFGVYYEELLFWYALQCRMELEPEVRRKVVVYLFVANGEEKRNEQIASLLRSYNVEVIKVRVTENKNSSGYSAAWFEIIGRLFGAVHKIEAIDEKAMDTPRVEQASTESSPEIIRIVRSETVASGNPDRCWMNIPLKVFNRKGYIDFLCYIDGVNYRHRCDSSILRRAFDSCGVKVIHNSPTRYSFYLDYETGEIFKTVSSNDTTPVITL